MGEDENGSGRFEGFRGVFNDIRLLLTDLLGLGKPDAEQQMIIEVFFGLMGYVAKADRLVSSHESDLANAIMDDIDLSLAGRHMAMEAFERGMTRNINVRAELLRFTADTVRIVPVTQDAAVIDLDVASSAPRTLSAETPTFTPAA